MNSSSSFSLHALMLCWFSAYQMFCWCHHYLNLGHICMSKPIVCIGTKRIGKIHQCKSQKKQILSTCVSLACINTYSKRWKDIETTSWWKCISGNISIRFSPSLRLLRQPSKSQRLSWMTKSFPYVRLSHVGADRWRPGAQLVHDSGEPSTGYTVHAASSLRKLYSFIIIRDVATAGRPAVTPPSRRSWTLPNNSPPLHAGATETGKVSLVQAAACVLPDHGSHESAIFH